MKVCTLIVRLVGIFMLVRSIIAFIEVKSMQGAMQTNLGGASISINGLGMVDGQMSRMQIYIWLGILTGLLCTIFAHFVARLLTFDVADGKSVESIHASES